MQNELRIIAALRRLNALEVAPLASWATELTALERTAAIAHARRGLPTAILSHHDRMAAAGKRSLAVVRRGTCGICRAPARKERRLAGELSVCDGCGAFLVTGGAAE